MVPVGPMLLPIMGLIPPAIIKIKIIPTIRIWHISHTIMMAPAAKRADEVYPKISVARAFDNGGFIRRAQIGAYELNCHYSYAGISD